MRAISNAIVWALLLASTSEATSSVISASSSLRSDIVMAVWSMTSLNRILMLTSWSLQSTPAELSIASV